MLGVMKTSTKSIQIGIRISEELKKRLDRATSRERDPYAPTLTQVVERGLELALKEFEERRRK